MCRPNAVVFKLTWLMLCATGVATSAHAASEGGAPFDLESPLSPGPKLIMFIALLLSLLLALYLCWQRHTAELRARELKQLSDQLQESRDAVRKSEEHYRSLVENINDMYFVSNREGKLTYGSPRLFSMTGYDAEELMGKSYTRLIAPVDRRRVVDFYLQRDADGTVDTTCTFRARNRAGQTGWVEQATRIIRDAEGGVLEYRNLVRDIGERKRAEERIHMLAHAIRSTNECVTITDNNNYILFVNDAFLRTYGYQGQELIGRHIAIIRSPNGAPDIYESILPATLDGGWQGELLNRRKDGSEFPIALSTSVVRDERGDPIALVGVARDITKRRKTEVRTAALSQLAHRLSSATTAKEAARIIVEVADDLFGWDACALALYVPEQDVLHSLLCMDVIEGLRREVSLDSASERPGSTVRQAIQGPQLILREQPASGPTGLTPFGDVSRPSMSLMFAPIRHHTHVTGILTIQSYTPNVYNEEDLDTLQALADHCGGALQRLRAEERRQQAEEQYHEIFENAMEGIYRTAPDGRFIAANPALARMFGYDSPAELMSCVSDIGAQLYVDPSRRVELRGRFEMESSVQRFESEMRGKDGGKFWITTNGHVVRNASGNAVYFEGTVEDITHRKRAEMALQQQFSRMSLLNEITRAIAERQEMQTIFHVVLQHLEDHMPVDFGGIYLHDEETDQLTVAARGPRSQEIAHLLGHPEGSTFPVDDTGLRDCLQGNFRYLSDLTHLELPQAQDLVRRGLHATVAVPLRSADKVFGILVVARRDINGFSPEDLEFLRMLSDHVALAASQARLHSDLRHAYDELRQTQQAVMQQERLRALGQMASGIAHDINNALSPVVGFAELLLATEETLTERARRYLQKICMAGTDIAQIVARMREFYRQRDERTSTTSVRLNELAQQVIEMTAPGWRDMPQERGVVIELRAVLEEPFPVVQGVEAEIREALTNLVFNAVDALPRGGTITVRTLVGRHSTAVVQVADSGIGMDEETRRRCLEPFFSTKGERGTGLGLAMVYGIMQRHDGDIHIESRLGIGTTVELSFPLRSAVVVATVATGYEVASSRPLRILTVDDEPALRDLLQEMLSSDGHETATAENGSSALAAFREAREQRKPFDVVITDLGMREMDGRQVARSVKLESPDTAVIMITGWGARLHADDDIPKEVDVVLNKPPRLTELRAALADVRAHEPPPSGS